MNEEDLKRLIEKYYDGLSTDEDEKALRAFFTLNDSPYGYETEKEIFSFFMESGEVPEPSADFETRIKSSVNMSSGVTRSARVRRILVPLLSAAAGLLILAGSYFFLINSHEAEDTFTDPRIAYSETMKILMDVSTQLNYGSRSLQPVGKINEMKIRSLESINKSTLIIEKNMKSLGYLRDAAKMKNISKGKLNN
jgi:hypothetical protein